MKTPTRLTRLVPDHDAKAFDEQWRGSRFPLEVLAAYLELKLLELVKDDEVADASSPNALATHLGNVRARHELRNILSLLPSARDVLASTNTEILLYKPDRGTK